ncbi:hypothetical protein CWB99_14745 [Pseudoalteromonas rubra]|jgi:elongation factor P hydroxylase|uniref:Uncharacterized protein n=1 Tax=Pseudoalteromonas rubra TaxID=43658 RepID=A0A5S3X383_9GAMM|nr:MULTISPECIES: hypothetical protein [Pseudoalteromonas]AZZ97567.1 hypothetical protein ELR70_10820 [Pseudoalteromonas sp. R3]TMP27255.1 hypothetical protein CWB99_14745 [Pseudoalteromonas rubra]TMP36793.1 hypothetical protein CWC00_00630 [Pseudoalteromonas rubra]TMP38057.1 hypothetical protein CWB98_08860 [Pseudoalteromonas rubra]
MSAFWNYRVIYCEASKDAPEQYQVHAVEYNENGKAVNWSETGESPYGQSIDDLKADFTRLQTAFDKPVLKVIRKPRGYELVEKDTGDVAHAEPPAKAE